MSLGALITPFTPGPSCLASTAFWEIETSSTATHKYQFFGVPSDRATGCFPPGWNPASTAYYSPAKCPVGYTGASMGSSTLGTATETTEVCCPSAFRGSYHTQSTGNTNKEHPFLTTLLCEYYVTNSGTTTFTMSSMDKEPTTTALLLPGGALNAYAIIVRYQSSDFAVKITTTGATSSSSSSSSGSGSTGIAAATHRLAESGGGGSGGGLSTGASIGIAVSLGIVGLGLIFGAVFLVLRRRRKRLVTHSEKNPEQVQYAHQEHFHEYPPVELGLPRMPQEMDAMSHKAPSELDGSRDKTEGR